MCMQSIRKCIFKLRRETEPSGSEAMMTIMNENLARNIYNGTYDKHELEKSLSTDNDKERNEILRAGFLDAYREEMKQQNVRLNAAQKEMENAFDEAVEKIDRQIEFFGIDDYDRILRLNFFCFMKAYDYKN